MPNRAQRRAAERAIPRYKRGMTKEERIKAFYKNGITEKDLQENYELGLKEGRDEAAAFTLKTCYAAFILAMRSELHFGRERCRRILVKADEILTESLSSEEAIDKVWEEIGLHLEFNDPFERIQETDSNE